MNINLTELFKNYTLETIVIGIIVAIFSFILDKIVLRNKEFSLSSSVPFILGVIITLFYRFIFKGEDFYITEDTFCSGTLAGSLSFVFFSLIRETFNGGGLNSKRILAIKGVIYKYYSDNDLSKLANIIDNVVKNNTDNINLNMLIVEEMKKFSANKELTEDCMLALANSIIIALNSLK